MSREDDELEDFGNLTDDTTGEGGVDDEEGGVGAGVEGTDMGEDEETPAPAAPRRPAAKKPRAKPKAKAKTPKKTARKPAAKPARKTAKKKKTAAKPARKTAKKTAAKPKASKKTKSARTKPKK